MLPNPDNKRRTIAKDFKVEGHGIHKNEQAVITFKPAASGTGIKISRAEDPSQSLLLTTENADAEKSERRTVMNSNGVVFEQLEHVMAALAGCGITDVELVQKGLEPPFLGGGSKEYMDALVEHGFKDFEEQLEPLVIDRPFAFTDEDGAELVATPHDGLRLSSFIEFPGTIAGSMGFSIELDTEKFHKEVSAARTFAKKADIDMLWQMGLAKGGNLKNAVVFDESEYLNDELLYPDEVVRHKIIDLLGDLALIGRPLVGHFWAWKAGHRSHVRFAQKLKSEFSK